MGYDIRRYILYGALYAFACIAYNLVFIAWNMIRAGVCYTGEMIRIDM